MPCRRLDKIDDGSLQLSRKDGVIETIGIDVTVLTVGVRSCDRLLKELSGHYERLYTIGDAKEPGRIGNATRSAFKLACPIS